MKGTKKFLCLMLSLVLVGMTGCSKQIKPTPSAEPSTDPQDASTALQDSDVDVLVIGAGGAGLSAAVSATENGASVIVVEKMSMMGGNTLRSGGAFNSYDPEGQASTKMDDSLKATVEKLLAVEPVSDAHKQLIEDVQKQYDEYLASGSDSLFDSPEWHALQTLDAGDYIGNIDLILTLTRNTLNTKKWLTANGTTWDPTIRTVIGALWNRSAQTTNVSGADFIAALSTQAEKNGAQIYLDTKAESLLQENGKVVGATITNAEGKTVTVNAKSVVMATGGFAANVEMRVKYNTEWDDLGETIATNNHPGATGDGIVMGEAVGADLVDMGWIQLMPLFPVSGGGISGYVNNAIYVNKEGLRYVNEDNRRDVLAQAALNQTDKVFFVINDQTEIDSVQIPQANLDYMVENGMLFKGDTIEELAENMGVPADNLKKTIEDYGKAVDAQQDEFGRATWGARLDNPPYYAASYTPAVHHTMGGLRINTEAQVLNASGEVIPGFYAAGEVTGGIHGTNRVGGNAVPDALVFGKIAGANAAAQK